MKAKLVEQEEARRLRTIGVPMRQIASRLGVSPGSVHLWTSDIQISEEQLKENRRAGVAPRHRAWSERHRKIRRGYQEEGRHRARDGNLLHQGGCMLYWAEGAKAKNTVLLANSDPHMLVFFRRFLSECFDVAPPDFTMSVNVYLNNGISIDEIERFWLSCLSLPQSCVRTHILNHMPTSSSGQRRNKLPYGVCRLRVHSTRIVQHIYGAIQEYAGFDEPRWLDCAPRRVEVADASVA